MLIYLCDDEYKMLENLEKIVQETAPKVEIQAFNSGGELMGALNAKSCDVLFLDIDMPEISGMDVAKWIQAAQKQMLLIFVTSHDELVYESFQYHPFGFVRKQFLKSEIKQVMSECVKELQSKTQFFFFRAKGMEYKTKLSEIQFFEADGNYLKIHTDKEIFRFRSTVAAVENTYGSQGFIRIHKGFLVNQAAVKMICNDEIHLDNGLILPIGMKYVEETKRILMRSFR